MKLWLEGNQRCCDRETAIELGGSEYRNPDIKTILHFDEYISIRDNDEVCHRDTPKDEVLTADWYKEIKDRTIERWQTIGGGIYSVEVCISLLPKKIKGVSR